MRKPISPAWSGALAVPESGIDLLRWLVSFMAWTRPQMMRAMARTTEAQLHRPGAIAGGHGDGSLFAAYVHVVDAEGHWLGRWMGTPFDPDQGDAATVESVGRRWDRLDAERAAWLAGLTPAELTAPFMELTGAEGGAKLAPLWPALIHVVLHTAHHRAEIYEALTRCGIAPAEEPDVIDYVYDGLGGTGPCAVRVLDRSHGAPLTS